MATVLSISETTPKIERNLSGNRETDVDDPAIYYDQNNPSQSIVIGTEKDAGLGVYDLDGKEIQTIDPGNVRYNNVDIVYNFNLGSQKVDLAIASERNNDSLSVFKIDPSSKKLTDITSSELEDASMSIFGVDDGNTGAYGLATYDSIVDGKSYVFVTQNDGNKIAQLELSDDGEGNVTATVVRDLTVPSAGGKAEGLVIDRERGTLYVGQENFGIYKFDAEANGSNKYTVVDSINNGSGELKGDVEGLNIYYGDDGEGYLMASSQGSNSFAVYNREGNNQFLGSFQIGEGNGIDGVQSTDGIDILSRNLGGDFSDGILVVQDGQNENNTTNFKYISLSDLAETNDFMELSTNSYNPRNPIAIGTFEEPEVEVEPKVEIEPEVKPEVEVAPETIKTNFQQGANNYIGTIDTFIKEGSPDTNYSNANFLDADAQDDGLEVQSILHFDNIFGSGNSQIPENAQIVSAQLELNIDNGGNGFQFHRLMQNFDDTSTWNSLDNGIQVDGSEAMSTADAVTGSISTGMMSVNVTKSLQKWQENPDSNHGWAILPTGSNGVTFDSCDGSNPPNLIVEYTLDDNDIDITAMESDI